MSKTNPTKTIVTVVLVAVICLPATAQGLSEKEARTARSDLGRSYRELILKLFQLNTELVVVVSKGSAARALDYKLVAEHRNFGSSMRALYQQELGKIAEWIETNRDDLEKLGISEVGLSSGKRVLYLGKSSYIRNKDGDWEFREER